MSWISWVASAFNDPSILSLLVWRCGYWRCPCILSSWRWQRCPLLLQLEEKYYEGGTVRKYLVQLCAKPSICHGPKVSTLHHLDVWRLRVTDPLASLKMLLVVSEILIRQYLFTLNTARTTLLICLKTKLSNKTNLLKGCKVNIQSYQKFRNIQNMLI